jgi:hypothetical protein
MLVFKDKSLLSKKTKAEPSVCRGSLEAGCPNLTTYNSCDLAQLKVKFQRNTWTDVVKKFGPSAFPNCQCPKTSIRRKENGEIKLGRL